MLEICFSFDNYRFFQSFSVGPIRIVLFGLDQMKVLDLEKKRYEKSLETKPPRFAIQTDATGSLCANIVDLKQSKWLFIYSFVRGVRISGDVSGDEMPFSFGDMITNDHTYRGIFAFYTEWKLSFTEKFKYWPPFNGMYRSLLIPWMSLYISYTNSRDLMQIIIKCSNKWSCYKLKRNIK